MTIKNLTQPALIHSMNACTKNFIHFILKGERGKNYSNTKKILESMVEEWKKRSSGQPA